MSKLRSLNIIDARMIIDQFEQELKDAKYSVETLECAHSAIQNPS